MEYCLINAEKFQIKVNLTKSSTPTLWADNSVSVLLTCYPKVCKPPASADASKTQIGIQY